MVGRKHSKIPVKPTINDIKEVLYTNQDINQRIRQLAKSIWADYSRLGIYDIYAVQILKGAARFGTHLGEDLHEVSRGRLTLEEDVILATSYNGTRSTGNLHIKLNLAENIAGRHVLVIEDIVDTGLTLSYIMDDIQKAGPASLRLCALLNKEGRRTHDVHIDYKGFDVGNEFVVGFGMDFNGLCRNWPFIAVLKENVYK